MTIESTFLELPWRLNHLQDPRRVGVEIEVGDTSLDVLAEEIHRSFGGCIEREDAFVTHVKGSGLGDFTVELDSRVLRDKDYQDHLRKLGIELDATEGEALERWLAEAAGKLVPHEIVTSPIAVEALPRLEDLVRELRAKGAKGTHGSILYAFGLQLNIEVHSLGADWISAILKAFILLYESLLETERIDFSRKLTPYVRPFPEAFNRMILQPDYEPDIGRLIDDYLEHNPTRNRPLDLLPLFAEIAPDKVDAAPVEHELIKPRPAFHYRLPNCEIDDPKWSLARPFNGWARVERLASRSDDLAAAASEYLSRPREDLAALTNDLLGKLGSGPA